MHKKKTQVVGAASNKVRVKEADQVPGFTRALLARLMKILGHLRTNRTATADELARLCGVNRRTILRDVVQLKDSLSVPIKTAPDKQGYCLEGEVRGLPWLTLSEEELLALFIAERTAQFPPSSRAARSLRKIIEKLGLSSSQPFICKQWLNFDAIHFTTPPPSAFDLDRLLRLVQFIQKGRGLKLSYRKPGETRAEIRKILPLATVLHDGDWYLVAQDAAAQDTRTFKLSRILDIHPLSRPPVARPDRDLNKTLERGFGLFFSAGRRHRVELLADPEIASLVKERVWHRGQELSDEPDGGLRVRFEVSSLQDVVRWVLRWAPHMTVVEPRELRDEVKTKARELLEKLEE